MFSENYESKNIIEKRNEEINNLYLRISDLEMKIIDLQDLCDNLNKIINEFKNMVQQPNNNNIENSSRKNRIEFINNISKYNIGTGFVCNNNE